MVAPLPQQIPALVELDLDDPLLATTDHRHLHGVARQVRTDGHDERDAVADRLVLDRDDDVVGLEAGPRGRGVGHDLGDGRALRVGLAARADLGTDHGVLRPAGAQDLVDGRADLLDRDREAHADVARLGLADVGRIARGAVADLLVLDGDPTDDPSILLDPRRIRAVFQAGRVAR